MSLTITAAVWHSRAGDTPAAVAGVFRQAAKLIQAEGYASDRGGRIPGAAMPHGGGDR